jgi:response regulator RpfG family c-di-GMP phosphodiesterase
VQKLSESQKTLQRYKDCFPKVGQSMLSGQAENEAVQNTFKNSNLKYFISKPWNKNDLVEKVNEILK